MENNCTNPKSISTETKKVQKLFRLPLKYNIMKLKGFLNSKAYFHFGGATTQIYGFMYIKHYFKLASMITLKTFTVYPANKQKIALL